MTPDDDLDRLRAALFADVPALTRIGITLTRWERRRVRWWRWAHQDHRAQAIILRRLDKEDRHAVGQG